TNGRVRCAAPHRGRPRDPAAGSRAAGGPCPFEIGGYASGDTAALPPRSPGAPPPRKRPRLAPEPATPGAQLRSYARWPWCGEDSLTRVLARFVTSPAAFFVSGVIDVVAYGTQSLRH